MPVGGYNGPAPDRRLGDRYQSRPEFRPGRESDYCVANNDTHDEYGRRREFVGTGWKTGGDRIEYKSRAKPITMADLAAANSRGRSRAMHSSIGALITYGASDNFLPAKPALMAKPQTTMPQESKNTAINLMLSMDETTMPGDLLVRKSGVPILKRMAALVRQRSLDMHLLINDFLQRTPHSKMGPQRAHAFIDIASFRRALCYAFGEQWTILGMTSGEFLESCA